MRGSSGGWYADLGLQPKGQTGTCSPFFDQWKPSSARPCTQSASGLGLYKVTRKVFSKATDVSSLVRNTNILLSGCTHSNRWSRQGL
eukprot:521582-Amphidinium_carterae.2